jgi:hypothetical protein
MWYALCGVPKQPGWFSHVVMNCAIAVILAFATQVFRIMPGESSTPDAPGSKKRR